MKKLTGLLLGLAFLAAGIGIAVGQEMEETTPPPKVLLIFREYLKPGKAGVPHQKTESAFVEAVTKAKWPEHYFALDSLTGRPRSLFFYGYDSFDAWEKDYLASQKNAALSAALDRASVADGELLSDVDAAVLTYDEEHSLRAPVAIAHMRYFEISVFEVRPGHRQDWNDLLKLVMAGYEKIPDAHWAMYELAYGQAPGDTYVLFSPLKSASQIDQEFVEDKDFVAAVGEDGMKRLHELEAAAIASSQSNLFAFNPKISYPPEAWVKADPEFWKLKAMAPMAPKKAKPTP
jgi:hypothetical protein